MIAYLQQRLSEIKVLAEALLANDADPLNEDQAINISMTRSACVHLSQYLIEIEDTRTATPLEFVKTIVCDFRNPVNIIHACSELLLMGFRGALTEPQKERISRIQQLGNEIQLMFDILFFTVNKAAEIAEITKVLLNSETGLLNEQQAQLLIQLRDLTKELSQGLYQ